MDALSLLSPTRSFVPRALPARASSASVTPTERSSSDMISAVRLPSRRSSGWKGWLAVYAVPALIATAAHVGLAVSGESHPTPRVIASATEEPSFVLANPVDPVDEEVWADEAAADVAPSNASRDAFAPPQLVDVPQISFDAVFVQPAQLATPTVATPGLLTVPARAGVSEGLGSHLQQVFSLAAVDKVPELRHRVHPLYPRDLQRSGVQGEVVVTFIVTRTGEVRDIEIVSSTHDGFEAAAVQAVSRWRFSPGTVRGQAVATRMEQPIGFSLAH